jgi:allantoate deiminase
VTGASAHDVLARVAALGEITEEAGRLTRRFATPELRKAGDLVAGWMERAGLEVRRDPAGNVVGRYGGDGEEPPLVLGSHLDTVPDAGRFDGSLGILVALAAVERLAARRVRLPFPVDVVAFADEEGARFGVAYLGSSAFTGAFEEDWLELVDAAGTTAGDALRALGQDPSALIGIRAPVLSGYVEVHIEQGPVLEREGLPVGVVEAIAGRTRVAVVLRGQAAHAGTAPMEGRRDALAAAAESALAVEEAGRSTEGLVATVGMLSVEPGASNVVPGTATLSVDVRHADDGVRRAAVGSLRGTLDRIASGRGVALEWTVVQETPAVAMDISLVDRLAAALAAQGQPVRSLVSGAGHDAAVLARVCPAAMLFVRCAGGVSHDPRESVDEADVAVALDVLEAFLLDARATRTEVRP